VFIVDLRCDAGHAFEGWYDSADEYRALADAREVSCPLCGSVAVERVPSATRISTTKTRGSGVPLDVQKALARVVQQVRATHEDVGEQFAKEATAIAKGDKEARPIRGTATPEEERRMAEEGVPFVKIPVPEIEEN